MPGNLSTTGINEATRISVQNQITNGTRLQLVVKGQSFLQAGDVIDFELREVSDRNPQGEKDRQFGGRYVITKIRHRVTKNDYKMILEAKKDSVREQIPGNRSRYFTGTANNENAQYQRIS